ncbi:3392_t:CDS:2, partial [Funneliformis geosporum]
QLLYKQCNTLDRDNQRLHKNNHTSEKKARRIKGANSLFDLDDERVLKYDKEELLRILKDNHYHFSEDS